MKLSSKSGISLRFTAAVLGILWAANVAAAQQSYLTNFAKSDNIYTNLNEQFPHSGIGVPGSGTGTPLASFLFDPSPAAVAAAGYAASYVSGSNLANNGVDFDLTSDALGRDFDEISNGSIESITANVNDAQSVYLLVAGYLDQNFNVTFTGADGTTEEFDKIPALDFNNGATANLVDPGGVPFIDQTVFEVSDFGGGGTGNSITGDTGIYDFSEAGFRLEPALADQELTSISLESNGSYTLLLGATAIVPEPASLSLIMVGVVSLAARRRSESI